MTSLRKRMAIALAVVSFALSPDQASAAANVIAGAIRWDGWYATTRDAVYAQNSLGPQVYQYRAPWFCSALNAYQVSCNGNQANIDLEIQAAANAGLKFWAFDQYSPTGSDSEFINAWNLYQSSSKNNLINWTWMAVSDTLFGSTGNFSTQVAQYVTWFQQSNYQKVLTNRPLLFMFFSSVGSNWGGSTANFAAMITALRTATTSAGLGTPYIVICGGIPGTTNFMNAIGADAISAYFGLLPTPAQPNAFSALNTSNEGFWTSMLSQGVPMIPPVLNGGDTRPLKQNPPPWLLSTYAPPYNGLLNYVTPATPAQIASQLQAAVTFVGANPTLNPTTAILIYSWTECSEGGGCMIPTVGDPPQAGPTTNLLTAIGGVLN